MNKRIRACFALFLALAVTLAGPLSGLADPAPGELPILAEDGRVYVWNVETDCFNQDAGLTEKPEIEGDLKPTAYAEEEGYVHPVLDLQASGEDTAFTVTGDVEIQYEYDGGSHITAILAEKLPDTSQEDPNGKSAKAVIGGDVTASSTSGADGDAPSAFAVNVRAMEGSVEVQTGDITAFAESTDNIGEVHETAFAKGVQVVSYRDGESAVTVDGDISASGKAKDGLAGAHGVSAGAFDGGTVDVHVTGDVTAESEDNGAANPQPDDPEDPEEDEKLFAGPGSRMEYSYTDAVLVIAEDGGTVNVTVDGAAEASSSEKEQAAAAVSVTAEDLGTLVNVTIGEGAEGQIMLTSYTDSEINVTVEEGGVTSDAGKFGAVYAESDKGNIEINITDNVTGLDSKQHPGYAAAMKLNASNEGTIAASVDGNVYATSDDAAEDGSFYAESLVAFSDGGTVAATISKTVWAVGSANGEGRADAAGISAQAVSQSGLPSSVTLEIGGDVEADANNTDGIAEALAISASATDKNTQMNIHVQGDAIACSDGTEQDVTTQFGTRAIFASSLSGGVTTVIVDGKAAAEAPEDLSFTNAVDAEAEGRGSKVTVQIGEGAVGTVSANTNNEAEASVAVLEGGVDAGMVGVDGQAYLGAAVEISIVGDITVHDVALNPGEAYGVSLSTMEGTVKASLDGNINAKANGGDAVGIAAGASGGTVEVVMTGDVQAAGGDYNYGIEANAGDGGKTDIIVDGTVEARDSAVVLVFPETQLGDNVTLTVWELVPNESGAVVSRKEDNESTEITEDEAAEKAVQYIIRVRADQQDIIDTNGTEEYKGYDVAHEGDTVTLKLTVPEGYEITGAYGDVNQSVQLLQDADGNYYLVVPRGGAVELSVKLEPVDTYIYVPDTQEETETDGLLTVIDQAGETRLTFFSPDIYTVKYADGSSENGTYALQDDQIVLVNDNDPAQAPMAIELNPDTGKYELAFRPSADPEKIIMFEMEKADTELLYARIL